jgi:hypothetical protein
MVVACDPSGGVVSGVSSIADREDEAAPNNHVQLP